MGPFDACADPETSRANMNWYKERTGTSGSLRPSPHPQDPKDCVTLSTHIQAQWQVNPNIWKALTVLLILSTVNGVSPSPKKSALKRKEISFCVSPPWVLSLGASDFRALSLGHSSYSSLGTEYLLLCSCFMLLLNCCMWGSFLLTGAPVRSGNCTGCLFLPRTQLKDARHSRYWKRENVFQDLEDSLSRIHFWLWEVCERLITKQTLLHTGGCSARTLLLIQSGQKSFRISHLPSQEWRGRSVPRARSRWQFPFWGVCYLCHAISSQEWHLNFHLAVPAACPGSVMGYYLNTQLLWRAFRSILQTLWTYRPVLQSVC